MIDIDNLMMFLVNFLIVCLLLVLFGSFVIDIVSLLNYWYFEFVVDIVRLLIVDIVSLLLI